MSLDEKIRNVATVLGQVEQTYTPATFANSFGAEDVVMTDLIARHAPGIEPRTLNTRVCPRRPIP